MGKTKMIYSKLLWKYLCGYGIPRCRCWYGGLENGGVYEKCTLCPGTYRTTNTLCDHIHHKWEMA